MTDKDMSGNEYRGVGDYTTVNGDVYPTPDPTGGQQMDASTAGGDHNLSIDMNTTSLEGFGEELHSFNKQMKQMEEQVMRWNMDIGLIVIDMADRTEANDELTASINAIKAAADAINDYNLPPVVDNVTDGQQLPANDGQQPPVD